MLLSIASILPILLHFQNAAGAPVAKVHAPAESPSASGEPAVMARLWVVVFDASVPGAALPIDPRRLDRVLPRGGDSPRDSAGRIATTGLAVQEELGKLQIECQGYRLLIKEGRVSTESPVAADPNKAGKPPWTIIAAPAIVARLNQSAEISVGQPVVYLERRSDGLFEAKSSSENVEGVSIKLTPSKVLPKGIRFTGVRTEVTRVADREPVEGLALPVGKPRMESRETSLDVTLDDGRVAIVPLPQAENEPAILVFLTAQRINEAN